MPEPASRIATGRGWKAFRLQQRLFFAELVVHAQPPGPFLCAAAKREATRTERYRASAETKSSLRNAGHTHAKRKVLLGIRHQVLSHTSLARREARRLRKHFVEGKTRVALAQMPQTTAGGLQRSRARRLQVLLEKPLQLLVSVQPKPRRPH